MNTAQSENGRVTVGLGVHNPLTARLAERAGFDLLWLGSLELATSLGLPDINLLSLTEVAGIVRAVRGVTSLPIYVDADNGYGSDATALRAVAEFEAAGANAICIEDNLFPKRNSLLVDRAARRLEDADDFARRIERMVAARSRLRIIARTEALVAGLGVAEAVRRLRRYADAGADALFVQTNHRWAEQLLPVVGEVAGLRPMVLAPTALPELRAADLERFGQVTLLFANVVIRGIVGSLPRILRRLHESGSLASVVSELEGLDGLFELTDTQGWARTAAGRE
jgi:phosphoenolpyruvate phosphomutase